MARALHQPSALPFTNANLLGDVSNSPSPEIYKLENTAGIIVNNISYSNSFSSPSSTSNSDYGFVCLQAVNYHHQPSEEAHSLINFKASVYDDSFIHDRTDGSLLSFDQNDHHNTYLTTGCYKDDYSMWEGNLNQNPRPVEDFSCFETASSFSSMTKENHGDWLLYSDSVQESGSPPEAECLKRPHMVLFCSNQFF